jgi:anaerobic ribonucleoside-triphosphate reductase
MYYKVRKRNGAIVTFDKKKIEIAIRKAIESVAGSDYSTVPDILSRAEAILEEKV